MKQLQDILGESNITMSGSMSDIIHLPDMTAYTYIEDDNVHAAFINFAGLGTDYTITDLKTYGFDSVCATCNDHYSIKFIDGNSSNYYTKQDRGTHHFMEVGVDISINDGNQFAEYLYNIILSYPDFTNHFQQYAYKDNVFYIYDYRYYCYGDFYGVAYTIVTGITATYKGPDVYVGSSYNLDDVEVIAHYDNGESEQLNKTDFTVSTQMIDIKGRNEITVNYFIYIAKIYINGIYEFTKFNAEYIGNPIPINTEPSRIDILVQEYYNETDIFVVTDWTYKTSPIVTLKNDGVIVIERKGRTAIIKVPYLNPVEPISFEAHYHGKPIKIGEKFNPADVHSRIILSDKTWIDLHCSEIKILNTLVTNNGHNNIYKATYINNGIEFEDYFTVYGYDEKVSKDQDFKIFIIHDNLYEEDVTDFYYKLFYNETLEKIYVNVNVLNKNMFKAKYRMILPKDTGMNKKYATEWIVVKDYFNVKTTLIKVYDEEEE